MFTGFTDETIQFFLDLKFHNSTEYFHQNHDRYLQVVQTPFYEMISDLSTAMLEIDPDMEIRPYKCLSRIHRDIRFTKDKSPYRDHMWFLFRRSGEPREKSLFYYFEMGPDRLDWGMGFWGENREVLDVFRKRILSATNECLHMVESLNLEKNHLVLGGTSHKRMVLPNEVPDELKRWYLSKEMYIYKMEPQFSSIFSNAVLKEVKKDFGILSPLYRLFRGYVDEILIKK